MRRRRSVRKHYSLSRIIFFAALTLVVAYWFTHQLPHAVNTSISTANEHQHSSLALPGGWPLATQSDEEHRVQLLENKCYVVGYSNERGDPLWVTYALTRHQDGEVDKRQSKFLTDERTSARIVHEHYNRSGYDRGHMAPNHAIGALCDDEAQKETFLMSNIVPQSKALNQRWWERLERVELTHFTQLFDRVLVIDGPIFSDHPINLPNGPVALPDACYKIFVAQKAGQWHVLAFMVDQGVNGDEPLSVYRTTIADIEAKVGFDFLPNLPEATKQVLKSDHRDASWQLEAVDLVPTRF